MAAQDIGLPLSPPYLLQGQNFSTGANFAVIGSTAVNLNYYRQQNITNVPPVDTSINFQLNLFEQLKNSTCNPSSAGSFFKKKLFFDTTYLVAVLLHNLLILRTKYKKKKILCSMPGLLQQVPFCVGRVWRQRL
jgi:hypothetical protein